MIALLRALSLLLFVAACAQAPVEKRKTQRRKPVKVARPRLSPVEQAPEVKADEALLKKLAQKNAVIIDLRDINEFVNGHLKGAVHMDFLKPDIEDQIAKLNRSKRYLLYSSTGGMSGKAIHYFTAQRLRAENLGTFDELKSRGAPVEGVEE